MTKTIDLNIETRSFGEQLEGSLRNYMIWSVLRLEHPGPEHPYSYV
jgi:hypothetical protein